MRPSKEKNWTNLPPVVFFPCGDSPPVLFLNPPKKPDLPSHQKASLGPDKNIMKSREWNCLETTFSFVFRNHLLTWEWPGLRGGDKSSSEFFLACVRLLGGDWSESDPRLALGRLLGGDWSESEAFPFCAFFRGGDWSESEFLALFLTFWDKSNNEKWIHLRPILTPEADWIDVG